MSFCELVSYFETNMYVSIALKFLNINSRGSATNTKLNSYFYSEQKYSIVDIIFIKMRTISRLYIYN